jgi:hypothetical protein
MSETLEQIRALVARGEVRVSLHGHDSPAVVVTAYRPDPTRWDTTWRRRLT